MRWIAVGLAAALLAGCTATPKVESAKPAAGPVEVRIIGFNDFHGALQPPPGTIKAPTSAGEVELSVGGAAYFASAIQKMRAEFPGTLVVSAGDMISASPLTSSLFLDEPTIHAMNVAGVDLNAVGNHEFDRGRAELLRMQNGGCEKNTRIDPCQLEPFPGAKFKYLAANVATEDGSTIFPGTAIRSVGSGPGAVKIGFIGMTLEGTDALVSRASTQGLSFRDEADTANALIGKLKAEGADAIVVLIHEGLYTEVSFNDKSCGGVSGALLKVLERLDPAVDLIVSGHTHRAYICEIGAPDRRFLVTSAGNNGRFLTDIRLSVDPVAGKVVGRQANNVPVQRGDAAAVSAAYPSFPAEPKVAAMVERYAAAARERSDRPVGKLSAPAKRSDALEEQVAADLIADAQLASAKKLPGGADVSFMNPGGVRADLNLREGGVVTFGDLYQMQPFGNQVMTKAYTGRQLKDVLEQQFDEDKVNGRMLLGPSASLRYAFDLSRPKGSRVIDPRIDGAPIEDARVYRVSISNFLAEGGDGFTTFRVGTDAVIGETDLEALETYIAAAGVLVPPVPDRVRNLGPAE